MESRETRELTRPWRCPPHGAPALLTGHQPRQTAVTVVSSQFAQVSDSFMWQSRLSTLQGDAVASPPAREGGCAGSIATLTAARKQPLVGRSPRYNSKSSKSRTIQQADPAGTVNAPSPAISTLLPAAAATHRYTAPAPV